MSKDAFEPLPQGTYVLATKYSDGESGDDWAVGFIERDNVIEVKGRYHVVNNKGQQFRRNGFRRAEKITDEEGDYIIKHRDRLSQDWSLCLWKLLAQSRGDLASDASIETHTCQSCDCGIETDWAYCAMCGVKLVRKEW